MISGVSANRMARDGGYWMIASPFVRLAHRAPSVGRPGQYTMGFSMLDIDCEPIMDKLSRNSSTILEVSRGNAQDINPLSEQL